MGEISTHATDTTFSDNFPRPDGFLTDYKANMGVYLQYQMVISSLRCLFSMLFTLFSMFNQVQY
jgi:hypothetical protein